jgi:hypothetical protein
MLHSYRPGQSSTKTPPSGAVRAQLPSRLATKRLASQRQAPKFHWTTSTARRPQNHSRSSSRRCCGQASWNTFPCMPASSRTPLGAGEPGARARACRHRGAMAVARGGHRRSPLRSLARERARRDCAVSVIEDPVIRLEGPRRRPPRLSVTLFGLLFAAGIAKGAAAYARRAPGIERHAAGTNAITVEVVLAAVFAAAVIGIQVRRSRQPSPPMPGHHRPPPAARPCVRDPCQPPRRSSPATSSRIRGSAKSRKSTI